MKQPKIYIYVLKLESNKYYIGKTSNLIQLTDSEIISKILPIKFNDSTWYTIYKPIKLIEYVTETSQFDIMQYILSYMAKHGIDNVRGGCFSEITLSYTDYIVLSKMIRETYNHCLYCNSEQHTYFECQKITNKLETSQYVINPKKNSKTENCKTENSKTENCKTENRKNSFDTIDDFIVIEKEKNI